MRRFFVALVVAAVAALVPLWAVAGNQDQESANRIAANRIAASLKESGKLHGYQIGIKCQDGIVWLKGQVSSREQMNTAIQMVFQTPGVTRVINNLTVVSPEAAGEPALRQPQSVAASPDKLQQALRTLAPSAAARPTTEGSQTLKPASGALAAEQLPRSVARDMRTVAPQTAQPTGVAERVPTAFAATPVQPVNAMTLEEPTLAPPRPIAQVTAPRAVAEPVAATQVRPVPAAFPAAPSGAPLPIAQTGTPMPLPAGGQPPMQVQGPMPAGASAVRYDQPNMPNYAWPGYAAYPNYASVTYPKQYSPTAWPYIGPFYPYPQVPLGWRKVTLEWHDGWWNLDFDDGSAKGPFSGLFRPMRRH